MKTIIARYNEDISWAEGDFFVVQKGEHLPNKGRETSSYLWYIIENYNDLEGEYYFKQGDPFPHYPDKVFVSKPDGHPHHPELRIHELCGELGLPLLDEYEFVVGACFKTTADIIKKRPLSWYRKAYDVSMTNEQAPWIFERIWKYIFV